MLSGCGKRDDTLLHIVSLETITNVNSTKCIFISNSNMEYIVTLRVVCGFVVVLEVGTYKFRIDFNYVTILTNL